MMIGVLLRTIADLPTMIGVLLRTIADLPMMIGVVLHPIADLPMMIGVGLPTKILVALLSIVLLVPATILPAIGGGDIPMGRPPTIVIATALPIVSMPLPISTAAPTTIILLLHTVADSECGPISLLPALVPLPFSLDSECGPISPSPHSSPF
jgi:hypothetical protein